MYIIRGLEHDLFNFFAQNRIGRPFLVYFYYNCSKIYMRNKTT